MYRITLNEDNIKRIISRMFAVEYDDISGGCLEYSFCIENLSGKKVLNILSYFGVVEEQDALIKIGDVNK